MSGSVRYVLTERRGATGLGRDSQRGVARGGQSDWFGRVWTVMMGWRGADCRTGVVRSGMARFVEMGRWEVEWIVVVVRTGVARIVLTVGTEVALRGASLRLGAAGYV